MPVTFSVEKLTDIFTLYYSNCKYFLVSFILILFWIMIVNKSANNLLNILSGCICLTILLFNCSVRSYSFVTPWIAAHQCSLLFTISWSLIKLLSIESVMPSNHLILCCPLLLLPSVFPGTRVFTNESVLCTVAKVLRASASASVLPMNIQDWFPLELILGFPGGLEDKESSCNAGDLGLIPGLGRSPGAGNGNPLQYSCLENPNG